MAFVFREGIFGLTKLEGNVCACTALIIVDFFEEHAF